MRTIPVRLALFLLVASTFGCDQATKHMAAVTLADQAGREYLAGLIRLEYVENVGAFLSLGADWPEWLRVSIFTVGTSLMLLVLAALAWKHRLRGPALVGLSLALAGGASNLLDRMVHGAVIDFINVGIGPLRTGIFNLADVAVLCGIAVVSVAEYQRTSRTS